MLNEVVTLSNARVVLAGPRVRRVRKLKLSVVPSTTDGIWGLSAQRSGLLCTCGDIAMSIQSSVLSAVLGSS